MTICNVRDFGAAGNRQALDTAAIHAAIDAAGRCNGQVRIPAGEYRSGSLMLRSGVSLHLEAGASLVASRDMRDFAAPAPDSYVHHTGSRFAFIHAIGAADVHILGSGTIDGNLALDGGHRGPLPLMFENCRNLRVEGIRVVDSPGWAVTFWGCRHVTVARVQILDSFADGLNPCCCQDVLIEDVTIDGSGDDPVCLKNDSHRYEFATRPAFGFVSRDISIRRVCIRNTTHPAFKIGTGTHGVFRNIEIADCRLENTGALFCVQLMRPTFPETLRRAIERVHVHDIRGDGGSWSAGPHVDGRQPVRHRRPEIPAHPCRGDERAFAGARPGGRADPEHHAARRHAGGSSGPNAMAARPVRGWPESAERAHQPGGTGTDGPAVPGLPEADRRWTARGWRRCGSPGPDPELAGRELGRLQRCGDCQAAGERGGGVLRRRGRGRTCRQGRCGSGGAG